MISELKIKRLPEDVVKKIAAGEVVTGPYAVVKELVENSLDANATRVEIEIVEGGKSLIKVADDGEGMSPEDLLLAVEHHCTSKISSLEDLDRIFTYGFRGEALASIAQVSRLTITTRREEDPTAVVLQVDGGERSSLKESVRQKGTTVEVRDLFFNIPARRRFLKSANVEGRMVTEIVHKFALVSLDQHLVYIKDGKMIYNLPPAGDLKERVVSLFPQVKRDALAELEYREEGIKIGGLISLPIWTSRARSHQFVFVNGRYVRNGLVLAAAERGYAEMLEHGRHPFILLQLELDPEMVDVNVHPQKLEVKFYEEQKVLDAIKRAIRQTLRKHYTLKLTPLPEEAVEKSESTFSVNTSTTPSQSVTVPELQRETSPKFSLFPRKVERIKQLVKPETYEVKVETEKKPVFHLTPFALMKNRYVLCEYEGGLAIVDFHALHERLVYEDLVENLEERTNPQFLVLPVELEMDELLKSTLEEQRDFLESLGFRVSEAGEKYSLVAVPAVLIGGDYTGVVYEILEELKLMGVLEKEKIFKNALASLACHSAFRTGDTPSLEDVTQMIKEMERKNLRTCPHGRPLVYYLEYSELDRYFGRS
ncbi:MAG: mismatch repair protein MutL [Thermotogota bacterium]|nr:mismatch repair protein MutL [Thermotogota bacterium]MDK2864573.1 mismatch repair protein MutL [Thermotogota bacterium]HCZ07047.1 DNA mismatch repair endonuclease MutL [Thermotogota bacterium]